MKVLQQDTEFQPVAIVLETREELELMWKILQHGTWLPPRQNDFRNAICDEITNRVKS